MTEKVLSILKQVVVACSILLNGHGKLAAEPNQTDFVYSVGDCDPWNTGGEPQVNCEGMNKSLEDVASEVEKEMYEHVQITVNTSCQVHMNKTVKFMNLTCLTITGTFRTTIIYLHHWYWYCTE